MFRGITHVGGYREALPQLRHLQNEVFPCLKISRGCLFFIHYTSYTVAIDVHKLLLTYGAPSQDRTDD